MFIIRFKIASEMFNLTRSEGLLSDLYFPKTLCLFLISFIKLDLNNGGYFLQVAFTEETYRSYKEYSFKIKTDKDQIFKNYRKQGGFSLRNQATLFQVE